MRARHGVGHGADVKLPTVLIGAVPVKEDKSLAHLFGRAVASPGAWPGHTLPASPAQASLSLTLKREKHVRG
jgi:hypothetical protein